MQAILNEAVKEKWAPIIECEDVAPIAKREVRNNTIRMLENQEKDLKEATVAGDMANWDPVLISMVRRSAPTLIANDLVGVQPMSGPTGLIFAIKSYYGGTPGGVEALGLNEPDATYSGDPTNPTGKYDTADAEVLGGADQVTDVNSVTATQPVVQNPLTAWKEMSFDITSTAVTAQSRALKAKYTEELAQDLKAIHGLDAETELANILSGEIVAEQNREMVNEINTQAVVGAPNTQLAGTVDISNLLDADGRWEMERFKNLIHYINKESNQIARDTRRGRGNFIIASANVVSALQTAGRFHDPVNAGGIGNLDGDVMGVTFAGVMNGMYKVYIDPYSTVDYVTVGYKGANVYDAGIFWAPYVPLNMVKAVGEEDFQPRIGFKTRYGLAYNPFVSGAAGQNSYYRTFNILGL